MEQKKSVEINIITNGKLDGGGVAAVEEERSSSVRMNQKYVSNLSPPQMESLSTLCDTFLPSINLSASEDRDNSYLLLQKFFQTSPSMIGTPKHVSHLYIYIFLFLNSVTDKLVRQHHII